MVVTAGTSIPGKAAQATVAALALALCFAGMSVAAQSPITKSVSVSGTATIQAIDSTNRLITLRDEKGQEDTYAVGPEITRFNELKVGDKVKMTYYESLVLQVRKPGDKPAPSTAETAVNRGKGALPGGSIAMQEKMTVTVKSIDPKTPSITVTTPDGRTVTRKVEDPKNLAAVKVGDQIDITYTQALLASIERAK
jgi:Cu/Ag efflux protein CusF